MNDRNRMTSIDRGLLTRPPLQTNYATRRQTSKKRQTYRSQFVIGKFMALDVVIGFDKQYLQEFVCNFFQFVAFFFW